MRQHMTGFGMAAASTSEQLAPSISLWNSYLWKRWSTITVIRDLKFTSKVSCSIWQYHSVSVIKYLVLTDNSVSYTYFSCCCCLCLMADSRSQVTITAKTKLWQELCVASGNYFDRWLWLITADGIIMRQSATVIAIYHDEYAVKLLR